MSQTFPEPTEEPEEQISFPDEQAPTMPMAAPPRPVRPSFKPLAGLAGPAWRQTSLSWMQKSQEITVKWLYELGGWIFGGLLIAALLLLYDLILLGSADRATLVAGLAIALALPFNLAGLGLIRYYSALTQAVVEAKQLLAQNSNLDAETLNRLIRNSESFSPGKHQTMDMSVSLALYLSIFLTLIGASAALWRISWAVTLLFLVAVVLAFLLVLRVIRRS